MCGIAGYSGPIIPGKLEKMCESMHHRGPDDDGFFHDSFWHLGIKRLAILDIETGNQPVSNESGTIHVVFNGEIYNHSELRTELVERGHILKSDHSDTELIPHLYEEFGLSFVEKINGMFAICLLDTATQTLYLFRDRIGERPVYYAWNENTRLFEFASEFNSISKPGLEKNLNPLSLRWYFSYKCMPWDQSIDTRIKRLPPGNLLKYQRGEKPEVFPYYRVPVAGVEAPPDEKEASRLLLELLQDSIRLRLRADVEVGAFLSGGLDSSLVVALASLQCPKPLRTFCLTYDEEIYNKKSDQKFARLVSERYRTNHQEVLLTPGQFADELPKIVRQFGQPFSATISNWFISRIMAKTIKVALNGDGPDELFGTYFLHRIAGAVSDHQQNPSSDSISQLPAIEREFALSHMNQNISSWINDFSVFPDSEQRLLISPDIFAGACITGELDDHIGMMKGRNPLESILEYEFRLPLPDQVLNYGDVLSLAHSLELRIPYLDHRIVNTIFGWPYHFKSRNGVAKYLLKQVAAPFLPGELIHRKKEGFVEPNIHWLLGPLKSFATDHFNSRNFNRLGVLNLQYVRQLIDKFWETKDFYVGKKIWNLLMFAIWESQIQENGG